MRIVLGVAIVREKMQTDPRLAEGRIEDAADCIGESSGADQQ
jgi:hypothetical protein